MPSNFVVLIVDHHPGLLTVLSAFVESMPRVRVLSTCDFGRAAVWIAAEKRIDLVLASVWLRGDFNGLHVAELAVATHSEAAVVMMSSTGRSSIQGLSDKHAFIRKPFGVQELMEQFDDAFIRLHKIGPV